MAELPVITLHQPWASLIACGAKKYETRSWRINHRGDLAIHAAKRKMTQYERSLWEKYGDGSEPPLGAIVAVAQLEGCPRMRTNLWGKAKTLIAIDEQSSQELALGQWTVNRYAWRLENVRKLQNPLYCLGKRGIWYLSQIEQILEEEVETNV